MNFYSLIGVRYSARILAGFLLTGMLLACPGALLPVWGYHIETEYVSVGLYFLFLSAGVVAAVEGAPRALPPGPPTRLLAPGSAMACLGFLLLATVPPPAPAILRLFGMLVIGVAAGLVNTGLMGSVAPMYERDPGATATVAGACFGAGCLIPAALGAAAFHGDLPLPMPLYAAIVPAMFAILYFRCTFPATDTVGSATIAEALSEFRSPAAAISALLPLVQLGDEWALGGWLPLFLIHRLGISPMTALSFLGAYWLVLLAFRMAALTPFANGRHRGRNLFLISGVAVFGCVILLKTDNQFGAWIGTLFAAAGLGALSPAIVGRIGSSFADYHAGFFGGVFALAVAGGLLSPALIGWLADVMGIWVVAAVPCLGTAIVVIGIRYVDMHVERQSS